MAEIQYQLDPGVLVNETADDEYQIAPGVLINETVAAEVTGQPIRLRQGGVPYLLHHQYIGRGW